MIALPTLAAARGVRFCCRVVAIVSTIPLRYTIEVIFCCWLLFLTVELILQRSWTEAGIFCQSKGMKLVSIETAEENDLITADQTTHGRPDGETYVLYSVDNLSWLNILGFINSYFWTSGSDAAKEGEWIWTATGQPITYFNWCSSCPDNRTDEDYLILVGFQVGIWDDWFDINDSRYTACESSQ